MMGVSSMIPGHKACKILLRALQLLIVVVALLFAFLVPLLSP